VLGQHLTHRLSRFAASSWDAVDYSASSGARFWTFVPFIEKHLSSVRQAAQGRIPATPPVRMNSTLGSSPRSIVFLNSEI